MFWSRHCPFLRLASRVVYGHDSHAVLKVLNCDIGFQDLEKVLNLTKMYMKYWKSMEIQI